MSALVALRSAIGLTSGKRLNGASRDLELFRLRSTTSPCASLAFDAPTQVCQSLIRSVTYPHLVGMFVKPFRAFDVRTMHLRWNVPRMRRVGNPAATFI